ncbi:uncharacterized protein LOC132728251 [Ruditapes philippinarum]|uniref:uncharacterized protein LOC132728251 n=1 Tax=Ruditapes philippinarum TaxID=129788 RepID=UPI00295B7C4D|nr:uncharacterized protein LOC132728251 [Ruditapes philippinarum]
MSSVKGKSKFKLVQNVTENVQREAKARMKKVTTCLEKLKVQIDAKQFDALEFQKLGGSHDEKQIKSCLEDICMKVKNIHDTGKWLNDIQKILKTEISSLKNEISHFWDTDEPALDYVQGNHPKLVKDILDARHMLNQKKKEVAKEASKRESGGREAKLQQHVDELWKLAFDSENNKTGRNSDEGNLLNMLEKITPEIKKLKNLQATMEMEIKALNDDVAKYDDQIEPSIINDCSEHPRIINDILNTRKQLSSKTIDVTIQIKDSEEDRNKGISTLKQHVITLWQLATETEKLPDNDDHDSVSNLVKLLTDIKLQMKYERNKQEEARKEKQSQEHAIKYLWERIYPGKVISGEDVATLLVDIVNYATDTQEKLEDFDRIEDLAFKVEDQAHRIYLELTCSKHSYTDDSKTANGILKRSLEILQSCKNETNAFIEIVTMLEVDLNIDRKSDSVSNRCKAIKKIVEKRKEIFNEMRRVVDESTHSLAVSYSELLNTPYLFLEPRKNVDSQRKKVPEWFQNHVALIGRICACTKENKESFQIRYVRREDYDNLQDKMINLLVENEQLREDKDSAYNRLSKVAGARLTDNNPYIADLGDPNRPTKIAEQFSELHDDPWTEAYEILKDKDQENTDFLLKIIVDCYEICGKISMNHQRNLKNAVCYPANNIEVGQASEQKKGKTENPVSFSAVPSKALSELRKQTADISVVNVISQIESVHKGWFGPKKLRSYTTRCIELCWLMHVQTPPIVIDTCAKPGSNFDTSRYKQYTKAGKKIDFVVWPVLLLEEGGAILCKGVAQGK